MLGRPPRKERGHSCGTVRERTAVIRKMRPRIYAPRPFPSEPAPVCRITEFSFINQLLSSLSDSPPKTLGRAACIASGLNTNSIFMFTRFLCQKFGVWSQCSVLGDEGTVERLLTEGIYLRVASSFIIASKRQRLPLSTPRRSRTTPPTKIALIGVMKNFVPLIFYVQFAPST